MNPRGVVGTLTLCGLEIAEPLEALVERVGRIVDRLPGGPRRTGWHGPASG